MKSIKIVLALGFCVSSTLFLCCMFHVGEGRAGVTPYRSEILKFFFFVVPER